MNNAAWGRGKSWCHHNRDLSWPIRSSGAERALSQRDWAFLPCIDQSLDTSYSGKGTWHWKRWLSLADTLGSWENECFRTEEGDLGSTLKCLPKSPPCATEIHLPCKSSRDCSFGVFVGLFSLVKSFKRKVNGMNPSSHCFSWSWGWTESSPWWAVVTAWLLQSCGRVPQFYQGAVACQELCAFERCLIFHCWRDGFAPEFWDSSSWFSY